MVDGIVHVRVDTATIREQLVDRGLRRPSGLILAGQVGESRFIRVQAYFVVSFGGVDWVDMYFWK